MDSGYNMLGQFQGPSSLALTEVDCTPKNEEERAKLAEEFLHDTPAAISDEYPISRFERYFKKFIKRKSEEMGVAFELPPSTSTLESPEAPLSQL